MFGAGRMGGGGWTKSDTWVQTLVPRMSLAGQVPFLGPHHLDLGKVEGVPPEMKFSQANEEHPKRVGDTQEDQGRPGWLILNTGRKVGHSGSQFRAGPMTKAGSLRPVPTGWTECIQVVFLLLDEPLPAHTLLGAVVLSWDKFTPLLGILYWAAGI